MTHTSPEREHLARILAIPNVTPQSFHYSRAEAILDAGYRRLPIDQALEDTTVVALAGAHFREGMAQTVLTANEANEFGQRLMKLTPGGSEYFKRKGDAYVVDIDAVVAFLERHHHYRLELARRDAASRADGAHAVADTATPAGFGWHLSDEAKKDIQAIEDAMKTSVPNLVVGSATPAIAPRTAEGED